MEKSHNQLLKLFYVRDYLLENSNKNHIVNSTDIKNYLARVYQIYIHENTVYSIIDLLQDYEEQKDSGVKIKRLKRKGYYIEQGEFQLHELQLLIDCVQATKFVTHNIASRISKKLKQLINKHDRYLLDRQSYISNKMSNMNEDIFKDIENIHTCIKNRNQLNFRYFYYNVRKEKIPHKKLHRVSPYALIWHDFNYYLVAYERKKIKHFRVDRMDNITLLIKNREGEDVFENIDFSERYSKIFSMYGGEEKNIRLRFHNSLVSVVLDRFGSEIGLIPDGERHFTVNIAVEVSDSFFGWLLGLGRKVIILSPDSVIEKMSDYVSSISKMYKIHLKKVNETIK